MEPRLAGVDWVRVLEVGRWPFVALIGISAVIFSRPLRTLLSRVTDRVTGFQGFGFEIALSSEAAHKATETVEETFATYRRKINARFDSLVRTYRLDVLLERLVEQEIVPHLTDVTKKNYRVTIHVPDVLFDGAMYQLLDYYPTGGGRGRTLSMRFGIVGRAWRVGETQQEGDVTTDRTRLVRDWAMTRKEAAGLGQGRRSFSCIVLTDHGENALGLLYLDSQEVSAFDALDPAGVQANCNASGLIQGLASTCEEMRKIGPQIVAFGQ